MSFQFERLESRILMAASIKVRQAGNTLVIRGTGGDDAIGIFQIADTTFVYQDGNGDGVFTIGVDDHAETLLGTYTGVENIRANLKRGDDFLLIAATDLPGDVKINLGSGNNRLGFIPFPFPFIESSIGGNVIVKGGSGDDRLLVDANIDGDVRVSMGAGDDAVLSGNSTIVEFGGHVDLKLGRGNDQLEIQAVLPTTAKLDGGKGSDTITLGFPDTFDELVNAGRVKLTNFELRIDEGTT